MRSMTRKNFLHLAALVAAGMVLSTSSSALAKSSKPAAQHKPKLDLADTVQGTYYGDIISDSRGSSQSDVTVTVTKAGPNTVKVTTSERLPTFTVKLTRAMQTIQQARGDNVFLVDQSKSPWRLDVTVDEASWSGTKR
jgi:hypothetical protein